MKHVDPCADAHLSISILQHLKPSDLDMLCQATEDTLDDSTESFSIGLSRSQSPSREVLESYWKGVRVIPERILMVGRIDGVIASSLQLIKPAPNNQTSSFAGVIEGHFVAPWARGHGLAKELLSAAEEEARRNKLSLIKLSVRASSKTAITLYESCGYQRWGTLEKYEMLEDKMIAGHFYCKDI